MIQVNISPLISNTCPHLTVGLIAADVKNTDSSPGLWVEIEAAAAAFGARYSIEQINKIPSIQATRRAYKALGKDPNRYRPSAEALCRRVVKNMELYHINTLVDMINLVSIQTGYSIGGFDAEKIQGALTLTAGTQDDVFEAIGRGLLNIEGLPVYKDEIGGVGTPTSDNERTKITMQTSQLLMIINAYSGMQGLQDAMDFSVNLLEKYAGAVNVQTKILNTL